MRTLFYRFLILIVFSLMGVGIGYGLSYTQPEKWKVTAQFEQPNIPGLGNYYSLLSTYNFLNADSKDASNQVGPQETVEYIYAEFKRNLTSADLLKAYLEQTESVKLKAQVAKKAVDVVANEWVEQFSFEKDANLSADNFSLISDNPTDAQKLLNDFILLANAQTRDKLNADLITKWKVLFQQIKTAAELNMGTTRSEQPWEAKLQMMRSVQPLDNQIMAYRLVKSPSVSTKPISPDRFFWLMIGALTGLVIGFCLSFAVKVKNP